MTVPLAPGSARVALNGSAPPGIRGALVRPATGAQLAPLSAVRATGCSDPVAHASGGSVAHAARVVRTPFAIPVSLYANAGVRLDCERRTPKVVPVRIGAPLAPSAMLAAQRCAPTSAAPTF